MSLRRRPEEARRRDHDLIVVGGGIYGVGLTLEASLRGLRPLLVERRDFGGGVSWNSFRILHGGFRYLQSLDLRRHRASVRERRWFLRHLPDLVEPQPFLMPLYGHGLRRPAVLRVALAVNDLLSLDRNRGVRPDVRVPRGRLLDAAETAATAPPIERHGLQGGALWYDAILRSAPRVLMELLRWACRRGARALNYVEAEELIVEGDRVAGIRCRDRVADDAIELRAPVVVNATGPGCRRLAARWDRDVPALFRPALAFNLLLDHPPVAGPAVGVSPDDDGDPTYFLCGIRGKLFAGTFHAGIPDEGPGTPGGDGDRRWWAETTPAGGADGSERSPTGAAPPTSASPRPPEGLVRVFLEELDRAVPGLDLRGAEVLRVLPGLQPATAPGRPQVASRPTIHAHGEHGGPPGLFSVSGVKYTTARAVAERLLERIFGDRLASRPGTPEEDGPRPRDLPDAEALRTAGGAGSAAPSDEEPGAVARRLRRLVEEEAVVHLDDLLFRRTDWGVIPADAEALAGPLCRLLGWDPERTAAERRRVRTALAGARPG